MSWSFLWKLLRTRWAWIVAAAVLLYLFAVSAGRDSPGRESAAGESSTCTMRVSADILNVRSGPGTGNRVVGRLADGAVVPAGQTVDNGFRQLGPGRWAAQRYLAPVPGCDC